MTERGENMRALLGGLIVGLAAALAVVGTRSLAMFAGVFVAVGVAFGVLLRFALRPRRRELALEEPETQQILPLL